MHYEMYQNIKQKKLTYYCTLLLLGFEPTKLQTQKVTSNISNSSMINFYPMTQ